MLTAITVTIVTIVALYRKASKNIKAQDAKAHAQRVAETAVTMERLAKEAEDLHNLIKTNPAAAVALINGKN